MRILIHDYSGHPFQVQLSRELANRGYEVLHVYSKSFLTPRGRLNKAMDDPDKFQIKGIGLSEPFAKYSFIKRYRQEIEYAKLLNKEIELYKPDVIIASNTPIVALKIVLNFSKKSGIKFIFWLQDIYSVAMKRFITQRIPIFGHLISQYFILLERKLLLNSDRIVLITDDFYNILTDWNINQEKCVVIHNWAPLDEMQVYPRDNDWARKNNLHKKFCFMYSGTLGFKHNPELLLKLAESLNEDSNAVVVVISEGPGATWLKTMKQKMFLDNLIIMDFQPFDILSQVLASADVLLAILEPDAGVYSVPSKVLTYHCVGRPLLLAVPHANLAAQIVMSYKTGLVVSPDDVDGFLDAGKKLMKNMKLREILANNARKYAEERFDIKKITDRFERLILLNFRSSES
jgi:glycosyltransferase involved in cell wall biosynthesis